MISGEPCLCPRMEPQINLAPQKPLGSNKSSSKCLFQVAWRRRGRARGGGGKITTGVGLFTSHKAAALRKLRLQFLICLIHWCIYYKNVEKPNLSRGLTILGFIPYRHSLCKMTNTSDWVNREKKHPEWLIMEPHSRKQIAKAPNLTIWAVLVLELLDQTSVSVTYKCSLCSLLSKVFSSIYHW